MSPEQVTDAADVDGSADQWALAIVAFEIVTGHAPGSIADPRSTTPDGSVRPDFLPKRAQPRTFATHATLCRRLQSATITQFLDSFGDRHPRHSGDLRQATATTTTEIERLIRHEPARLRLIQCRQHLYPTAFFRSQPRSHRLRAYASCEFCTSYFGSSLL